MIRRVVELLCERMQTNGQHRIYWFTMQISLIAGSTCVHRVPVAEPVSKFMFSCTVSFAWCGKHTHSHSHTPNFANNISLGKLFYLGCFWNLCFAGERPEAMQTGTSTYIANNIMQTISLSIIISTFNVFQKYYTSILLSCRMPNQITWHTAVFVPKLLAQAASILRWRPHEMRVHQRWSNNNF